MAALVAHFKAKIGVRLLRQPDVVGDPLPVETLASTAFVQGVFGLNQFALILQQPVDAVVRPAAFFIRCQRDDQVAIRPKAFSLVADQVRDPDGRLRLVVGRSPPVEKAVFFNELEWIRAPVLPLRLNDIDVSQQQNWLTRAATVVANHQVVLGVFSSTHPDI